MTGPRSSFFSITHVRAYVWMTQSMGQGVGRHHETLLGARGTLGGVNDEVRFGEIKGVVGTSKKSVSKSSIFRGVWSKKGGV